MKKREIFILIFIGVVVAIIVIGLAVSSDNGLGNIFSNQNAGVSEEGAEGVSGETRTFSPEVPDLELTEPQSEVPAAPGVEARLRTFDMVINEDGYNPSQLVVNERDTININLRAEGGEYDISIPDLGLYQTVASGERKQLGFQALVPGTYVFECRDLCPGGDQISGQLVVRSIQ